MSRKVHGAAGTFDLPLSTTPTNPTTEPRQSATTTIVLTFDATIVGEDIAVTEGVASARRAGSDRQHRHRSAERRRRPAVRHRLLTNVCIRVQHRRERRGAHRLPVGDVNGSRLLAVTDLVVVNNQLGKPLTAANFLSDVNLSGIITVLDKVIVNNNLGHFLPAP